MTAPLDVDLAVVGSGFGGSLLAMIACRLGWRVALLERGVHPRFAIGESASPLAGVVLEQLARRYDLPRIAPLAAYGDWQQHYPGLGCGLKRGFTFFKHQPNLPFVRQPDRSNELLVAASPSDAVADTHWLRADVDAFLADEAARIGAAYIDRLRLDRAEWGTNAVVLRGTRCGVATTVKARVVVDATGPRGFLSQALPIGAPGFDDYPGTQALYSHFTDVARCADLPEYETDGIPPYPIDAAALHHVFDDGWMWVLRFDNGVTSAGVAVSDARAAALRLAEGEPAWHRLLAQYPTIAAQFADARPIREFTWMPRLAWRAAQAAGRRWALLPSAAAFVDPLMSTGIPMTLLGVERLARALESSAPADPDGPLRAVEATYSDTSVREADHVARFIAGCYDTFPHFHQFAAWSMFYFAAASFSELSRRLHGDTWSRGFLLADDGQFGRAMQAARGPAGVSTRAVAAAIAPINVAGLADARKRHWYGVDVEDAVAAAPKLGAGAEAIRRVFATG